jgi:hypothetical protein
VVESGKHASESWARRHVPIATATRSRAPPSTLWQYLHDLQEPRGQKVPVAVYRIDLNFTMKPFINDLMNATA